MSSLLAAIPYSTFPELGPFRTFGLMVGIGVLLGAVLAAKEAERWDIDRDATYRLATWLVVAGVVGARITWVLSNTEDIDSAIDVIAIWQGGLQFSGGFAAAVLVALPTFRSWDVLKRWRMTDAVLYGLSIGLAFGRVGCYSVGEHFGSTWGAEWFPLAVRFEGGSVREPVLGQNLPIDEQIPVVEGLHFHQAALYELFILVALFALLHVVIRRRPAPAAGTVTGLFCVLYGGSRFLTDFLRINDKTALGLTGAQYLMIAVFIAGVWILGWRRKALAEVEGARAALGPADTAADDLAVEPVDDPADEPAGGAGESEGSAGGAELGEPVEVEDPDGSPTGGDDPVRP